MSIANVSISQNPPAPRALPSSSEQKAIIEQVSRRCFYELAISLAIGMACIAFTATPLQGTLLFAAIAMQTICNGALRYADAMAAKEPLSKETQWVRSACAYLCPTMFSYLTAFNGQSLIHEAGHAAAASCLFRNANPQITITPSLGGITQFSTTHLTALGEKIGKSRAIFVVTLMGPACTLLVSGIAIAVGVAVQKKWPELAQYLITVGIGDFYAHAFYAFSALTSSPGASAHDFIRLHTYGIHPLAAGIAILAVPILITRSIEQNQIKKTEKLILT